MENLEVKMPQFLNPNESKWKKSNGYDILSLIYRYCTLRISWIKCYQWFTYCIGIRLPNLNFQTFYTIILKKYQLPSLTIALDLLFKQLNNFSACFYLKK